MDVISILRDLAGRLTKMKPADAEAITPLLEWIKAGGFESLENPVLDYLDAKRIELPPTPKIFYKYLQGPVDLTRHVSSKYNKDILVMGDEHVLGGKPCSVNSRETITLNSFLGYNILSTGKTVDVYLEIDYITSFFQGRAPLLESYLKDAAAHFSGCLTYTKTACQYSNARVHYTDSRFVSDAFTQLWLALKLAVEPGKQEQGYTSLKYVLETARPELKTLLADAKSVQNWFDTIMHKTRIEKQIRNIKDEHIRSFFTRALENEMSYLVTNRFGGLTYDKLMQAATEKKADGIVAAWGNLLYTSVTYMDLYLMARVFRSFRQVAGKRSEDPQRIIIYAGYLHADRYRKYLNTLGSFATTYTAKKTDVFQCLDISTLPLPLYD
ncbi:Hypothetical protein POVN_LOCUS550 [uncultured virus]|nr:Hypothetical protein POVN_LOCUS550 [uncultured virus]